MATYGQITTNTTYDSYFWVRWEQQSQDIGANKTIIAWSCGVYCGHSFYLNAIKMSAFSINGVQVYGGGTYSNFSKGEHQIAWGTLEIPHNSDGTKTFSISSFTGWLYSNYNYSSNGGSYDLPTIPRQATITSASDFTDVDNPSITFSNPGGWRIDLWLEPNPVGDHLCVRENIPNTGSYTWKLTAAERDALRNKCAGNDCTIRIGLYCYIGGTQYHDYKDKKFTMTENAATKPGVAISVTLNNSSLPSAFEGLYIQGKSKVDIWMSANGNYGAKINRFSANVDGKTYSFGVLGPNGATYYSNQITSDAIQSDGSVEVVGYARDARDFTGSAKETINVIAYSKPLVIPLGNENAIQCYRSDGNGKRVGNSTSLWVKAKKSYYGVEGLNTCALQYRWKKASEVWDDNTHLWSNLIPSTATTNEFNALIQGVVFDLKNAYTIQLRAIDTIGEYDIKTFDVPTQDVALHLGAGGKNVTIGAYCDYGEEYTFYSDWKAIFDKDVHIRGDVSVEGSFCNGINGVYVKTVEVMGGKVIRLQTAYSNWISNGTSRQSFLVFGSSNGMLVHGVCIAHNTGAILNSDITNCVAECEDENGVVKLTLIYDTWDVITILSASPFTILQ